MSRRNQNFFPTSSHKIARRTNANDFGSWIHQSHGGRGVCFKLPIAEESRSSPVAHVHLSRTSNTARDVVSYCIRSRLIESLFRSECHQTSPLQLQIVCAMVLSQLLQLLWPFSQAPRCCASVAWCPFLACRRSRKRRARQVEYDVDNALVDNALVVN